MRRGAGLAAHPVGLWIVKHLVSPVDRFVVRISGGRLPPLSSVAVPTLLLTVVGRRSGQERTTPLVFVRDGPRLAVCNVRPAGERRNPWVLNLRAAGRGRIQLGGEVLDVVARAAEAVEADRWWQALVDIWPAFATEYRVTGERSIFVLEPIPSPQVEGVNRARAPG